MRRKSEAEILRRAYAKRVIFAADVHNRRIEAAFAAVPREAFLGPGPWQIVRFNRFAGAQGYVPTPSGDLAYLYDDVVAAILPERSLNNGQPSLHARLMANAEPRLGEHVVHIGTGVGYYTAILAYLVGRRGKVSAIEYDAELAARCARNLRDQPQVTVMNGDGTQVDFAPADVIFVNAGTTHPLPHWLDRLRDGGRLIVPLTEAGFPMSDARHGAVFRIQRQGDNYLAGRISGVAIFPCGGGRDADAESNLATAFERGGAEKVTRLYRGDDLPLDQVWLCGKGWSLAYR